MKVDLSKCTEISSGVFQKTNKTFYVKDCKTGKIIYCNKEKIDALVAQYGSIENVGKKFTSKKIKTKPAKVERKKPIKSSSKMIEAKLFNDSGKIVASFISTPATKNKSAVLYSFENAKFDHQFIFVIKINDKLSHPKTKNFKEVKVTLFNGKTEEIYDAIYDHDADCYCVLDCDAAVQLKSIHIEH